MTCKELSKEIVQRLCLNDFPDIDPILVMAIIRTESSFDAKAYRYEAHIKDASYGLMQLLYGTAQWMGYKGSPEGLYDPETNIIYGMKFLQWLQERCESVECVIMSYNEGLGNYKKGKRVPQYHSKVTKHYKEEEEEWMTTIA